MNHLKHSLVITICIIGLIFIVPFMLIKVISESIIAIITCIVGQLEWTILNYKEDDYTRYSVPNLSDLSSELRDIWT